LAKPSQQASVRTTKKLSPALWLQSIQAKVKNTDKAALATRVIDAGQPGWLSPLDGIDWLELHAFADEHKMPLETVNDVLTLLRIAIGKM
jgi:hypothetical protein